MFLRSRQTEILIKLLSKAVMKIDLATIGLMTQKNSIKSNQANALFKTVGNYKQEMLKLIFLHRRFVAAYKNNQYKNPCHSNLVITLQSRCRDSKHVKDR